MSFFLLGSRADTHQFRIRLEKPSIIHQHGVMPIIRGRDCILQAPPSIARMTTFCIAIIQRLDMTINGTQALILTSSPENVKAFHETIVALGQKADVNAYICGDNNDEIQLSQTPPHIIIGTVESIQGAITRGKLGKNDLRLYCLDDAQQLLTYRDGKASFGSPLDSIYKWLPKDIQVIVASSAIADDTVEMIKEIMTRSIAIAVPEEENFGGGEQ